MTRKAKRAAEYERQVKEVGARLIAAGEKVGGPAVFLFCGIRADHGVTTIATAVSRAIASSGARTVLASTQAEGEGLPSHSLAEVLAPDRSVTFADSPILLKLPREFLELPEHGRDPRTWLKSFDVLVLDAPPLTEFASRYWVPLVHGVVLVVDGEKAGVGTVRQAQDDVARLGGSLTGVVLNRHRARIPDYLR